jgi:hypothetical protein
MVGLLLALSLFLSSIPEQTSQRPRHGRPKQGPAPCMHGLGQFLGACWLSTGVGSGRERTGRLVQQGKASVHSSTMPLLPSSVTSSRQAGKRRATEPHACLCVLGRQPHACHLVARASRTCHLSHAWRQRLHLTSRKRIIHYIDFHSTVTTERG